MSSSYFKPNRSTDSRARAGSSSVKFTEKTRPRGPVRDVRTILYNEHIVNTNADIYPPRQPKCWCFKSLHYCERSDGDLSSICSNYFHKAASPISLPNSVTTELGSKFENFVQKWQTSDYSKAETACFLRSSQYYLSVKTPYESAISFRIVPQSI